MTLTKETLDQLRKGVSHFRKMGLVWLDNTWVDNGHGVRVDHIDALIAAAEEVETLRQKLTEAEEAHCWKVSPAMAEARIEQLAKERDAWRADAATLYRYLRHNSDCPAAYDGSPCNCGVAEAIEAHCQLTKGANENQ